MQIQTKGKIFCQAFVNTFAVVLIGYEHACSQLIPYNTRPAVFGTTLISNNLRKRFRSLFKLHGV